MTDREIIIGNFVDKYYTISSLNYPGNVSPCGIRHKDNNFIYLNPKSFYSYIIDLYSNFITDEKISVWEMVEGWYISKYEELYSVVIKYLDENLNILLGPRNWIVKIGDNEFDWKELVTIFDEYNKDSLKVVYNDWYAEKVVELSESYMDEGYY